LKAKVSVNWVECKLKMKRKLKKFILKKILSEKEQSKLYSKSVILQEGIIPIEQTSEYDIFIAGFPKSGNTWMQNLIAGIQFGIETSLLPDKLTQELVPDIHGKDYYKRFGDIVFFKTHELPNKHMKRVIHLVRDGRDAMASYYAMNIALGKKTTLKEMIVSGKDIYPSKWKEHTRQWLSNPYNADILIVKYEDLIQDTFNQMKRIMAFAKLERSDEVIKRSVYGNSLSEMKRKEKEYGWNNKDWDPSQDFIRTGKIGSYKKEIPEDLIKIFETESKAELDYFDYCKK